MDGAGLICGHSACRQNWIDTGNHDCIIDEVCAECGSYAGSEHDPCERCKKPLCKICTGYGNGNICQPCEEARIDETP